MLGEISKYSPCYGGNKFYKAIDKAYDIINAEDDTIQEYDKVCLFLSDGILNYIIGIFI